MNVQKEINMNIKKILLTDKNIVVLLILVFGYSAILGQRYETSISVTANTTNFVSNTNELVEERIFFLSDTRLIKDDKVKTDNEYVYINQAAFKDSRISKTATLNVKY